jgi:hypothetical protein
MATEAKEKSPMETALIIMIVNQLISAGVAYARTRDPNYRIPTDAEIEALRDQIAATPPKPETVEPQGVVDKSKEWFLKALKDTKDALGG